MAARVGHVEGTWEWPAQVQQKSRDAGRTTFSEASAGLGVAFCTHEKGEAPLQDEKATKRGQCGVGGAIFRTPVRFGNRVHREGEGKGESRDAHRRLTVDSPSTHPVREVGLLRRHRVGECER
jgi:hypothetical protein